MAQTDMIDTKAIWTLIFYHSIADCGAAWKKTKYLARRIQCFLNDIIIITTSREAFEKKIVKSKREEQHKNVLTENFTRGFTRIVPVWKKEVFCKEDQVYIVECSVTTTAREAFTILPRVQLPLPLHPL